MKTKAKTPKLTIREFKPSLWPDHWHRHGVASQLLHHAVKLLKHRGARIIEGYPVSRKYGKEIPAAFAYTGVVPMFTDMGFSPTNKDKSWRQRMRKNVVGRRKSSK